MAMLWFWIAAVVVAAYVVMDGFDFGAGILHLFVAKTDRERRQVFASIGPFWDGNEVWLLAGGGILFLAFPRVLAVGLSGFYLAIMMLLWTIILRGASLELRSHILDPMWRTFWDVVFFLSSALAPILLGAALGNLLRGLPIDTNGWVSLPLFTSFSPHGELGVLDWYTVLVALFAFVAIAHHGALFLAWKTDGAVQSRSHRAAAIFGPSTILLWACASVGTAEVAPELFRAAAHRPFACVVAGAAIASLGTSLVARRLMLERTAFIASGSFIVCLLAATAASLFPTMIKSANDPSRSLDAWNASAGAASLHAGVVWWPAGFVLAIGYLVLLLWLHRGKTPATDEP